MWGVERYGGDSNRYGGKLKDMAGNGIYTEELVRKT